MTCCGATTSSRRQLLAASARHRTRFVYASSASVYGLTGRACERIEHEAPLNLYAFSKLLFDRYVRSNVLGQFPMPVVGLRYFNVYGEREVCKGRMASVIHHFVAQVADGGVVRLFDGSGGYGPGEQRRDFICVDDVVAVDAPLRRGRRPAVRDLQRRHRGARDRSTTSPGWSSTRSAARSSTCPFPGDLAGKYQHFTEADLTHLHAAGFPRDHRFTTLEVGVPRVVRYLQSLRSEVVP